MIKLLIGGSPCTHWSIAQSRHRETTADGIGWELFENYVIAKEKFQPDFFLYENNWSASKEIKSQIEKELGCDLMRINSRLVSAQNRDRFYVFNWTVEQPEDRGVTLRDIIETEEAYPGEPYCLRYERTEEAKKLRKAYEAGEIHHGYHEFHELHPRPDGKTNTLTTVLKDNLIIIPSGNPTGNPIYQVKNGHITIKGKTYPIKLCDGYYIIRKLTPIECERLQTLPDGYTAAVSNTQRYKGLGNGWTAEVIIHILQGALANVPRDEKIVVLSMYDGIGTGRYCLHKMGFKNVEYHAYEIDKYAIKVAMSNWPDIIQHGDAFQVRDNDWSV